MTTSAAIDHARLEQFMDHALADMGAAMSALLLVVGDRLGLYKAMAAHGPMTADQLADRTGTNHRYISEWLNNQAAGGYVRYDPQTGRFELPPEQAMALADESSPVFIPGAFQIFSAVTKDLPRLEENFRTGHGMHWGEHDPALFEGTERFFKPSYSANLVQSWIPSLDGVKSKLEHGAKVADVGCGFGASTILMAQAFPNSQFIGFDYHERSTKAATGRARDAGVADRCRFETADACSFPGNDYDFVTVFDCLHDMGNPVGAAKRVRQSLKDDGSWMIVEPFAGDRPEDNHNTVGRIFYAASTMLCVPCSLAADGPALGAQAGEERIRQVVQAGGFSRVRRATQTPFNMVLEAQP